MMADMEESTTEVAVTYPEVSTLPAIRPLAQEALDAMPSTPKIEDPDILDAMRRHVERARMALLDLRGRMSEDPTN